MIKEIDFPEAFSSSVEFFKVINKDDLAEYKKAAQEAEIDIEHWECQRDFIEVRIEKGIDRETFLKELNSEN